MQIVVALVIIPLLEEQKELLYEERLFFFYRDANIKMTVKRKCRLVRALVILKFENCY